MRRFNIAGPCRTEQHYMLPPEPRLPEVRDLIDQGLYFVVHAPRQTGKTTTMRAFARTLTAGKQFAALHVSCETGRVRSSDYGAAQRAILDRIQLAARSALPEELRPPARWPAAPDETLLIRALSEWAEHCPLPLALFLDEIDALQGDSLISVLSQLRDGYNSRPDPFPHSITLCGMRDVRDYKAASGGNPERLASTSPFNIVAKSLRLTDFTFTQVADLYGQHTTATGQAFTPQAVQRAFEASQGQPWLVNALAREVIEEMKVAGPIADEHMDQAVERLILARATHLDSLVARLHEPRIQRIIEPIIAGTRLGTDGPYNDDLAYVRDMGLVTRTRPAQIANPIYQEVIVRVLAERVEENIDIDRRTFIAPDGRLDTARIFEEFLEFWKQNGEIMATEETYHESACQLVFMAWLHRIVNGGGVIDREYALGRKRLDICVRWPYPDENGKRAWQHAAIELKVHHPGTADPQSDGLTQLDTYLDRLGLDTGTLVVFDRRPTAPPLHERTAIEQTTSPTGRPITLLRA